MTTFIIRQLFVCRMIFAVSSFFGTSQRAVKHFTTFLDKFMRNQLPVVQREWRYLSAFPEWPGSKGWLPVLIIPFPQDLIFRNGRQQSASLGSRPYLCVVVQGIALLGEYTHQKGSAWNE